MSEYVVINFKFKLIGLYLCLVFQIVKHFFCFKQKVVGAGSLVHGFKLFTEELFQIPMEKMNEKITSGTKATEEVGSHCYGLF